jgi:hypothetical protein
LPPYKKIKRKKSPPDIWRAFFILFQTLFFCFPKANKDFGSAQKLYLCRAMAHKLKPIGVSAAKPK